MKVSKLSLVDLAGSERADATGAKGERLKVCECVLVLYYIYNGNRTKWSPIWSVIISDRVISKSDNCKVGVWFVYHKYDCRQNWLLPINHNCYNFWKKLINLGQTSSVILEISLFSGLVVAIMVIVVNSVNGGFSWFVIGCFNCPITGVQLQPTVRLHCPIMTVQND